MATAQAANGADHQSSGASAGARDGEAVLLRDERVQVVKRFENELEQDLVSAAAARQGEA